VQVIELNQARADVAHEPGVDAAAEGQSEGGLASGAVEGEASNKNVTEKAEPSMFAEKRGPPMNVCELQ